MPISAGFLRAEVVEVPAEITAWRLLALPPGAAVVDVRKATDLAAFNAGSYTSICGGSGNRPTISGSGVAAAQGDALGVWGDVKVEKGNVLVYVVMSCDSSVEWLAPRLLVRRT